MRKTQKYVSGCKVVGYPVNAGLPHEAIYGMLALRGWSWDGKVWKHGNHNARNVKAARVMVEAAEGDCQAIALALAITLEEGGMVVKDVTGPYQTKITGREKYYITLQYELV